jgi:hypothetical protein
MKWKDRMIMQLEEDCLNVYRQKSESDLDAEGRPALRAVL